LARRLPKASCETSVISIRVSIAVIPISAPEACWHGLREQYFQICMDCTTRHDHTYVADWRAHNPICIHLWNIACSAIGRDCANPQFRSPVKVV
jgi:hypothetical protein